MLHLYIYNVFTGIESLYDDKGNSWLLISVFPVQAQQQLHPVVFSGLQQLVDLVYGRFYEMNVSYSHVFACPSIL